MMLFERLKHPDQRLEQEAPEDDCLVEVEPEHAETSPSSPVELSELEQLRSAARALDAPSAPYPFDARCEAMVALCLKKAHEVSRRRAVPSTIYDVVREVEATVLAGDWPTMLASRGPALAVVAELTRRGFELAHHEYHRITSDSWELRILFAF